MVREITVDENYQTVRLFDAMKKGDIYKVPYDKKRHIGIKLEASRRNRDLRLIGTLKNKMEREIPGIGHRVSGLLGNYLLKINAYGKRRSSKDSPQ